MGSGQRRSPPEPMTPDVSTIRPMPIPGRPETYHGGTAAESMQQQTGLRPMPIPKRPKPPHVIQHES